MKTIKNNVSNEIVIKNSRFITKLYKVDNPNNIPKLLENIKKEYKDATHYCYAYIIDNVIKSSDDGEPGGTAGLPMLQVLKNNELNYILAITIRYFGGIKLGAGGLVRAYTKSLTTTLDKSEIISLIKGYDLTIEFEYTNIKEIDHLLKDINITWKDFNEKVTYNLYIPDYYLKELINNNIKIIDKKDKYIEKWYLSFLSIKNYSEYQYLTKHKFI